MKREKIITHEFVITTLLTSTLVTLLFFAVYLQVEKYSTVYKFVMSWLAISFYFLWGITFVYSLFLCIKFTTHDNNKI